MAYRLDLPRRILHLYDMDARQSYAALSRKLGPSRDVIRRTINQFESDKTIRGYMTVLDIGRLGFTGVAVYARIDTADRAKQERLLKFLVTNHDIYWIALLGGRFDLLFAIQARSLVHFSEVLSDIQRRFPFVTNSQFAIRTRAIQFQRAYLSERGVNRVHGGFEATEEVVSLSMREREVIDQLIRDPRIPFVDMAKHLAISRITAQTVVRRLEERKIIQSYSALIDCRKLGFESHLVLVTLRRFDQVTRARVRKFAAGEPGIIFYLETIGTWQTEFHCEVKTQQELQEIVRRFRGTFPNEVAGLEMIAGLDYYYKYKLAI